MSDNASKGTEVKIEKLPEKMKKARLALQMNQTQLADKVGVTQRSITDYERGAAIPRNSTIRKLAAALHVTYTYLTDDESDDPQEGANRENIIENARSRFGSRYAVQLNKMLDDSVASFAGGEVPTEDMDLFMEAFMSAIALGKERARKKFTPKSIQDQWKDN
ncbi:MAG: helix-turn-helix transcriptional regulator [Clostridia bacterium]|nr:helix-turn-helix transcriptional regulator [Clostridia bacterium]